MYKIFHATILKSNNTHVIFFIKAKKGIDASNFYELPERFHTHADNEHYTF